MVQETDERSKATLHEDEDESITTDTGPSPKTRFIFKSKYYNANVWEKHFAWLPVKIHVERHSTEGKTVKFYYCWLTFVERKFSITQGRFNGVEYRTLNNEMPEDA